MQVECRNGKTEFLDNSPDSTSRGSGNGDFRRGRARLDAARVQVDAQGAEIERETELVERTFADLNERIRTANTAGSGWRSRDETAAAEARRNTLNAQIAAYNSAAAANLRDQSLFNEAVERYNLMLAYPDGLAEDRAKGLIR